MTQLDDATITTMAITQFLFEESAALDEARHEDWLAMVADDFRYHLPIPLSPDSPYADRYSDRTSFSRESKGSLRLRFDRVSSEYAWLDRPRHFLRHFVSNIRVTAGEAQDVWIARSNVLVARSRSTEAPTLATAARIDVIRGSVEVGFLLTHRTVHIDVEVPHASQLVPVY